LKPGPGAASKVVFELLGHLKEAHTMKSILLGLALTLIPAASFAQERGPVAGERLERRGERLERRGERLERRGERLGRRGERCERRGERHERWFGGR
jgi:hypothetical protein